MGTTNIAAAFVKAQKAFEPARKTSDNPFFKSRYADLSTCVDAVLPALNANGIAMMQQTYECQDGALVETVLLHESGESLTSGKMHVPASKQDAQGYGSALTYARRYSLMAVCGIAPEDDDGNAATAQAKIDRVTAPNPTPRNKWRDVFKTETQQVKDLANRLKQAKDTSQIDTVIVDARQAHPDDGVSSEALGNLEDYGHERLKALGAI